MRFVLDQHAELDFYSASSLKQQPAGRHVAPLRHIIMIPSQPVFALTPQCYVLSGEAANTNCIVFGLTRPGLELMIYCTRGEHANHYTTDEVCRFESVFYFLFNSNFLLELYLNFLLSLMNIYLYTIRLNRTSLLDSDQIVLYGCIYIYLFM